MAKKPITVKLEKEMLEEMDNECEGLGCNRTDFVIEAVEEKLRGESNKNSQDQEVIKDTKPEPKEPHRIVIDEIEDVKEEPKVIIKEVQQDNSNKPIIDMVLFNNKYIPFAKRYNI